MIQPSAICRRSREKSLLFEPSNPGMLLRLELLCPGKTLRLALSRRDFSREECNRQLLENFERWPIGRKIRGRVPGTPMTEIVFVSCFSPSLADGIVGVFTALAAKMPVLC